ncbi:hypothetical protein [Aestuariivivens sediminis]|uniref:hypothetical protein n=1 Tax=Aestuariivivens sediminis TaxID=2913557 RepID=UPI001F5A69BD|nr:hypothetical protein [Aestuariivivens sediminis]
MKSPILLLKTIALVTLGVFINPIAHSQSDGKGRKDFFRIYDLKKKKIGKGHINFVNDSLIGLRLNGKLKQFKFTDIGVIKTKRSGGHSVLIGSAFGASLGILIGVASANPDKLFGYTATEGAIGFGTLGAVGGGAVGGVAAGTRRAETFIINGKLENWKIFKEQF